MTDALERYEADVVGLLFARDPAPFFAAIRDRYGDAPVVASHVRWPVHRRMARTRVREAIAAACPLTSSLLGELGFGAFVDELLAESPPRSGYIRDLAGEASAFAREHLIGRVLVLAGADPAWRDALRYEAALREIEHGEFPSDDASVEEFAMNRSVVWAAAHRRLTLDAEVHALEPSPGPEELSAMTRQRTELLIYRDPVGDPCVLPLDARSAAMFDTLSDPRRLSVVEAAHEVAARQGVAVDGLFVGELSETLSDWLERGVLLGAPVE